MAASPTGCRKGRPIGRLAGIAGQPAGGIPAPPVGGAPARGAGFCGRRWASLAFRPLAVSGGGSGACVCRHGMVPPAGGMRRRLNSGGGLAFRRVEWCRLVWCRRNGAGYCRHGVWCRLLPARCVVPAIAGTVYGACDRRHGSGGGGAWQGPVGALQRTPGGVLVSGRPGASCFPALLWQSRAASGPAMAGPDCFREREAGRGDGAGELGLLGRRRGTAGTEGRLVREDGWRRGTVGTGE